MMASDGAGLSTNYFTAIYFGDWYSVAGYLSTDCPFTISNV